MALETRYDVTTQVPSSTVEARLPAMCWMETLTTVVSRISMKVASITDMVTTHGLTCLGLCSSTVLHAGGSFGATVSSRR